ncbi:MAG: DUF4159 domain-containing protein [Elusimicrobia bacterium]|nr:DUF4159 domain-containing protein [Elusimicrobiota bacterium]
MRFGLPAALWVLPLAALPVVVHLLSRRAARRVPFSDLTLLKAVDARARPKARLRELLLMTARCVLLAALILAAAAPARRGDAAAGGAGLDLVLLLDASYSTRARDGVTVRFDAAREAGRRLLKRLAPGDRVAVGVFDEKLKAPLAWGDARAADAALAAARPGWRGTNAAAALADARKALEEAPRGRKRAVVVLGDGAEHGLREAAPAPAEGAAVVGLRFPALPNAWIASAGPAPDSSARSPRVEVRLAASGAPAVTPLDLWVGDRRAGSVSASVPAGGEARAALALPAAEQSAAPSWTGRVAARAGALAEDDQAHFSIAHRPSPRVLVLYSDPQFFRAGKTGWFLRELFGGGRETLAGRDADLLEAARWNEADLTRYGTVMMADASRPSPGLSAALEAFAERGGGVVFIPGVRGNEADLAAYPWLPARLGAAHEPSAPGIKAAREGEATSGWGDLDLSKVVVRRIFFLEPAAGSEVWARAASGEPLLVAGSIGRGRAVVWASPLDAGWTNLGLKPFFIPWARACLALSVPESARDAARKVKVGDPIVREWSRGEAAPDRITVISPEGRRTSLSVSGRRAVLPEASTPGLYTFVDGVRSVTFAANIDPSRGESDLLPSSSPPWRSCEVEDLENEFLDSVYGKDLSVWLLGLAALMLILEMFLSLPLRPAPLATHKATGKVAGATALFIFICLSSFPSRARAQQGDRFVWTQLQLGDTWDPYPDAPDMIAAWLGEVTSVRVSPARRAISLSDPALFSSPFVYLAGTSAPPELRDDELRRLRQFISGGGFLWVEDSGGGPPGSFDRWLRRELPRVLPDSALKPLPPDHVLFRTFFLLRGPAGRVRVHGALEGVDWGGRVAVLYTRDDALGAWAKDALGKPLRACVPGGEPQRELAKRLTLNVVMYSLTGSYKSDAVHQAAILDKLKAAAP